LLRWRPDTPGRALLFGVAIVLVLELAHLAVTLAFVEVPSVAWLFERGNYRINVIISLLTGFSAAAVAYGSVAERRDFELRRRELGWSAERLGALIAHRGPRPGPALACGLALAPFGTLLITGADTSRPFPFTEDPWTVSIAWATVTNLILFCTIGVMAYSTWVWRRVEHALDAEPATLDLLDTAPDRRMAAAGLRRSFFWIAGSSLASLVFVDLDFSWMTGIVVSVTLCVGTALFVSPLRKLARRIRTAKAAELDRVRARIRTARDALLSGYPAGAGMSSELPALLAYEDRIEAVKPWAVDVSQTLRFVTLLALAVGSWLGGSIMDHIVDRFMH
jgi:hypothetical protein